MIKEDFIHYIWMTRNFDHNDLKTSEGSPIQIYEPGHINTDSGPDFFKAKISIGSVVWVGNVEIHIRSSDWHRHKHSSDNAFNNVILHVVFEDDAIILDARNRKLPCLELKDRIQKSFFERYLFLKSKKDGIPCASSLPKLSNISILRAIELAALDRLTKKSIVITDYLKTTNMNWEHAFLITLFNAFGSNVNGLPFELLARSLSPMTLQKKRNDLFSLEAILFGQAGFLDYEFVDEYPKSLKKEYTFLKRALRLNGMDVSNWKFLRMRPASFPTVRISQLAHLIHQNNSFFDLIKEHYFVDELRKIFYAEASSYWNNHYTFDKSSKRLKKKLSKSFQNHIFINALAPFLYTYGKEKNEQNYMDDALTLLDQLPFEKNKVTRQWSEYDVSGKSALESQGLIELKKMKCNRKKCLSCTIGQEIMKGIT